MSSPVASTAYGWKPELRMVLLSACYLAWSAALCGLPARSALSAHQARFGESRMGHLLVGLIVDVRDYVPCLLVGALVVSLVIWGFSRRRRAGFGACVRLGLVASCCAAWPILTLLLAGASEFRMERGLYPTWLDFLLTRGDSGFVQAGMRVMLLDRFLLPTIAAGVLQAAGSVAFLRSTRRVREGRRWRVPALVLAAAAVSASAVGLHRASPFLGTGLAHWRLVESPLFMFAIFGGGQYENIRLGTMSYFEHLQLPPDRRSAGAAALGLPGDRIASLEKGHGCDPHPFAVPLDATGSQGEIEGAAAELSAALWTGRAGTLRVWQILMESMRGEEIHGINPQAPEVLAPTLNALYARARSNEPDVVASPWLIQGGHRTSQGLSATLCGCGTMPSGLSFSRDFGLLPARCVLDVLKDAGFDTSFYYGANPTFDNMDAFLHYHGVERLYGEHHWHMTESYSGWGKPDGVVFQQAFEVASKQGLEPRRSQYQLLLSLTNHFPFVLPPDAPPERVAAVAAAAAERGSSVGGDDLRRAQTMAYADAVLGRFLAAVQASQLADETLILVSADHSDSVPLAWRPSPPSDAQLALSFSRIPFVVILPPQLIARAQDPARVRAAIRRLNAALDNEMLSQNDIPRLLLALLGSWHELAKLPAPWRWHSLGGQRLSPHFRLDAEPEAMVFGVGADSRLFAFDRARTVLPLRQGLTNGIDSKDDIARSALAPVASWLSSWMRTHASACRDTRWIRATQ
jgi:hypothetical protein